MFCNHELEDVKMVFPNQFRKLGIPSLNMVVCSFVSFCVDISYGYMEIFELSPSHVSTKHSLKVISCGNGDEGGREGKTFKRT